MNYPAQMLACALVAKQSGHKSANFNYTRRQGCSTKLNLGAKKPNPIVKDGHLSAAGNNDRLWDKRPCALGPN
jgi:hypothetical protein